MSEELIINTKLSDAEIYEALLPQINNLIAEDEPIISGLSNVTAALKQAFKKINWVGFYLIKGNKLFLGPFQGQTACTKIEVGQGVCGAAAKEKNTIIVDDVDKFPGHIACDARSKSEIVIPIVVNQRIIGVLDLDSYEYNSFNATDEKYLQQIIIMLKSKFDFSNFSFS